MKKLAVVIALLVLWGCQTASPIHVTEESTTVTGEVQMVAGAFFLTRNAQGREVLDAKDQIYVVREETGNEVPVRVNEQTKLDLNRRVSTGDKIEAAVSEEGYAIAIKPAQ